MNTAGLVLSVSGFAWLMAAGAAYWVADVLLGGGLLLSAAGAFWLVALLVRDEMTGAEAEPITEPPTAMPIIAVVNGPRLVNSLLS